MSCGEYRRLISGYLDETLSVRQRDSLLEHLLLCPTCARTLARYRQMGVLLRRLPPSEPAAAVRDRVLQGGLPAPRPWLPRPLSAIAGAAALLAVALGLLFPGNAAWPRWDGLGVGQMATAEPALSGRPGAPLPDLLLPEDSRPGGSHQEAAQMASPDDARLLQQVRLTVRRPDFRPLLPAYLPRDAHLDTVNFGRGHAAGPIDRLDVAFAAGRHQIQLRQLSGAAAASERRQLEARQRWLPPKRIIVAGHEWLYSRRSDAGRDAEPTAVLVGQRGGMTIWLESSLPEEELAKVAASLQE